MKGVITSPVIYYYYMSNCSSTGDILREIDSRSLIESSCFLLVNCGAITNLDITELWKEQKARYKQSPFNIMTSVFTHMPYYKGVHRKRDIALALTESNQILAYKNMNESDCFSVLTESVLENNTVLSLSPLLMFTDVHSLRCGACWYPHVQSRRARAVQRQLRLQRHHGGLSHQRGEQHHVRLQVLRLLQRQFLCLLHSCWL